MRKEIKMEANLLEVVAIGLGAVGLVILLYCSIEADVLMPVPEYREPTEEEKEASNAAHMRGVLICLFFWLLGAVVWLVNSWLANNIEMVLYSGGFIVLILLILFLGKHNKILYWVDS